MATVEASPPTVAPPQQTPPAPASYDGHTVAQHPPPTAPPSKPAAEWHPGVAVLAVAIGVALSLAAAFAAVTLSDGWTGLIAGFLIADAVLLGIVLFAATRGRRRVGPATFALRRTEVGPAIGWPLAIWMVDFALLGIAALVFGEGSQAGGGPAGEPSALALALLIVTIAVTVPIVEEIAFRGYLFPALTRWKGPWPAAIVSGALFGAAHFMALPPQFLVPTAIFGVGLCFVFWVTRSLLPCIGIHALNNGLVVAIAIGWTWQVPLVALGSMAAALLLVAPFSRTRAPTPG